ncbi:hypothetical protein SAMN05421813_1438 [Daejeonella rubra]|uniref:Uncharacterized protein n=1 Tax=Daejeonella rubra TaxID=990371 RepID=A0A1G9YQV1_9SPHI|nr:hypothetical protein SAMN05421813_1438 [Daejeonella rubra]
MYILPKQDAGNALFPFKAGIKDSAELYRSGDICIVRIENWSQVALIWPEIEK